MVAWIEEGGGGGGQFSNEGRYRCAASAKSRPGKILPKT